MFSTPGFVVEFGCKFLNNGPPIQDPLQLDVTVDQVFVVRENADSGAAMKRTKLGKGL